jgi:O-antigen/teichoic acid export membrane protein
VKHRIALLRNVAWVALAGYVEAAVGLAAGVMIARTLGPSAYGSYAFAIWLCGLLIMASNNAMPTSSIKFLAEARGGARPQDAAALAHRIARWQVASSALVLAIFVVVMLIYPIDEWHRSLPLMLGITAVAVWARAGFWMRGAMGKGFERFKPEAVALMSAAALNLLLVGVLAWQQGSVVQFFAVYAVLGLFANLIVRLMLRRESVTIAPGPVPDEMSRRLRSHLLLTGVLMLFTAITSRAVEMTLLKLYETPEIVGYFAIAAALTKGAVDLLAGGMSAVLLPAMSRRFGKGGSDSLASMLGESTRLYWFLGLAVAGLGFTVSEGLVHLLYGARYDAAIPAVTWNLAIAGLTLVNGAAAAVLTASDRQADRIRVVFCTFSLNVALGLTLIPRYGLHGAIASYGLSQLFEMVFAWWFASRRTGQRPDLPTLSRIALAAAIATGLGHAVTGMLHLNLAFIGGATVFIVTYTTLSVVFRTWRAADFETIANLVSRLGDGGRRMSERLMQLQRFSIIDPVQPERGSP